MMDFFVITVQITIIVFVGACIIGTSLLIIGSCIRFVSSSLTGVVQIREVMKRDKVTVFKAIATMRDHKTKLEMAEQKIVELERILSEAKHRNLAINHLLRDLAWTYDHEYLLGVVQRLEKEMKSLQQNLLADSQYMKVSFDYAPLQKSIELTLTCLEEQKANNYNEIVQKLKEANVRPVVY